MVWTLCKEVITETRSSHIPHAPRWFLLSAGPAAIDILAQSWLKDGNHIEEKTAMKKMFGVVMLLAALLSATSALASNSCLCVGVSATYMCGGIGGSFGRKHTPSDTLVNSYIQSDKARSYFSSQGKAYDPTTGWLCWKGTL